MTRRFIPPNEVRLIWISSSKADLLKFPSEVQKEIGSSLGAAQYGGKSDNAKPWHGNGSGVFEICSDHDTNTYRAVYVVRFEGVMYVLHAFQKKAKAGIKTPLLEQRKITSRLKQAQAQYEEQHGKTSTSL